VGGYLLTVIAPRFFLDRRRRVLRAALYRHQAPRSNERVRVQSACSVGWVIGISACGADLTVGSATDNGADAGLSADAQAAGDGAGEVGDAASDVSDSAPEAETDAAAPSTLAECESIPLLLCTCSGPGPCVVKCPSSNCQVKCPA